MDFMPESVPTAMIVVADGDIIRNQIDIRTKKPLPLGYDQYTTNTYGNKAFIENAISYLVEGESLIELRSREFQIRLLDPDKKVRQRIRWQLVNIFVPTGLVILLGLVMAAVRKSKYSFKNDPSGKHNLRRSNVNKMLFGVCGGMSEYFNIDVKFVRGLWIVLGFAGIGILAYLVFLIVLPRNK